MTGRFSIRYKFLTVTTLLLMGCVGAYLFLATTVFKNDKTELVFDYNRSLVTNIASEMESFFQGVSDKMKLIAFFSRRPEEEKRQLLRDLMLNNPDIVFVAESPRFEKLQQTHFTSQDYLETYALPETFFEDQLLQERPIPFEQILKQGQAIWNATTPSGAPLVGFGRSIVEETDSGKPLRQYAMIAFIRSDKLLRSLQQGNLNEVFIANHQGEILAHRDEKILLHPESEKAFVQSILKHRSRTSVLQMEKAGQNILGAFSKAFNDQVLVVSQVSEEKAFAVVNRLLYRSVVFALMVLTLAFIAAILFSRSLTKPLDVLMTGMKKVSTGDLETQIEISSKDEIQVLAGSFNKMIRDLRHSRKELEEINQGLELKVKERTQQLEKQNQAVKNAQEALLRTTRLAAVGEIAGRAAHEVLNPLTSILSRLELMKNKLTRADAENENLIEDIVVAWRRDVKEGGLEKLLSAWKAPSQIHPGKTLFDEDIENIEGFHKLSNQKTRQFITDTDFLLKEGLRINRIVQSMRGLSLIKSEKEQQELYPLLEEAVQIMADWVGQYDIELKLEGFDPNKDQSVLVEVDKDEFLQALTNLLRNATQAVQEKKRLSPAMKGEISVRCEVKDSQVLVFIRDNGIGISQQNQTKLFEGQFTTKSKAEGTGLGLNISRRFIRAVGGDIRLFDSNEKQGTCFVLSLPLKQKLDKERASA